MVSEERNQAKQRPPGDAAALVRVELCGVLIRGDLFTSRGVTGRHRGVDHAAGIGVLVGDNVVRCCALGALVRGESLGLTADLNASINQLLVVHRDITEGDITGVGDGEDVLHLVARGVAVLLVRDLLGDVQASDLRDLNRLGCGCFQRRLLVVATGCGCGVDDAFTCIYVGLIDRLSEGTGYGFIRLQGCGAFCHCRICTLELTFGRHRIVDTNIVQLGGACVGDSEGVGDGVTSLH